MRAQTVCHVWRRLLREVPVQQALFEVAPLHAGGAGLSEEEQDVANAYARRADHARWFVTNYRYRLTHSLLNALDTGAPLTLRARDYRSAHRLSAWLRDKTQLGRGDLSARLMIAGSIPLMAQDDEHLALLRSLKAIAGAGA